MALFFERCGPRAVRIGAFVLALGVAGFALPAPASAADINVNLDQAKLVKLPEKISTIVIGNPLIADAALQAGGLMVITGKGYGVTNILALDRTGAVLMEKSVLVQGPRGDLVVVYRGVERETYSCTPQCERRITLGDSAAFFDSTLGQVGSRNGQAQGAVPASK